MGLFEKDIKIPTLYPDDKYNTAGEEYINKLRSFIDTAPDYLIDEINEAIANTGKGNYGEDVVRRKIVTANVPMYVLHDLYIPLAGGGTAQIDYVLITDKLIIVVEVKNFSFPVSVVKNGRFSAKFKNADKYEYINSPIDQNKDHIGALRNALIGKYPKIQKQIDDRLVSLVINANIHNNWFIDYKEVSRDIRDEICNLGNTEVTDSIKNFLNKNAVLKPFNKKELAEKVFSCSNPGLAVDYFKRFYDKMSLYEKVFKDLVEYRDMKLKELKYSDPKYILSDDSAKKIAEVFVNDKSKLQGREDLKDISGIGDKISAKFGDDIINILKRNKF